MTYQFNASANPSVEDCARVAALSPSNPFCTPAYLGARRATGSEPWVLSLNQNGQSVSACFAFMNSGRLSRILEIPSLPTLPQATTFWQGLRDFCRHHQVIDLVVNSFGSDTTVIPVLGTEIWRHPRNEYILDLGENDLLRRMSTNHKRNVRQAEKADLFINESSTFDACCEHARVAAAALERHKQDGAKIDASPRPERYWHFVEAGAGVLYQAVRAEAVLASVLILKAEKGGYYHSAGAAPAGLAVGAGHFLIYRIAASLRDQGATRFNLGGALSDQSGLQRFKNGFGARPVELEAAQFFLASKLRWALITTARSLRNAVRT